MNVFIRIGNWWESRRVLRKPDLEWIGLSMKAQTETVAGIIKGLENKIEVIEAEKQIPSTTLKEFNMLKVRLERIELLVGLRREQSQPTVTNGMPKIS